MKLKVSLPLTWRVAALALNCWLVAGCDSAAMPTPFPTSGRVTFEDGTPVPGGTIVFGRKNIEIRGDISPEDGRFSLSTYEKGDGAIPGDYRVYFLQPAEIIGAAGAEEGFARQPVTSRLPEPGKIIERTVFPKKYLSPKTSGLTCKVEAKNNQFDFKIGQTHLLSGLRQGDVPGRKAGSRRQVVFLDPRKALKRGA